MSDGTPHLRLSIVRSRVGEPLTLTYDLGSVASSSPMAPLHVGPVPLGKEPEQSVASWARELEGPAAKDEADRALDLVALGSRLVRNLLPEPIARALGRASVEGTASDPPVLEIVSNETAIPWELAYVDGCGADGAIRSGFLGETFIVARWIFGEQPAVDIALRRLALIALSDDLPSTAAERRRVQELALASGRSIYEVPDEVGSVVAELGAGRYDAWHYAGHAENGPEADRAGLRFKNYHRFVPDHLGPASRGIRQARPFFFWNACSAARGGMGLTRLGGWAARLLALGASAYVAPFWKVTDSVARHFAEAFYTQVFQGVPLAAAVRLARLAARSAAPNDPSWLAYAVFAHPKARTSPSPTRTVFVNESSSDRPVEGSRAFSPSSKSRIGYLSTAPPPPDVFAGRRDDLLRVLEMLGAHQTGDEEAPQAILHAVRGLAGIGKTSLAAVLAARPEIQDRYPDGLLWLPFGSRPDLLGSLANLGPTLGDEGLLAAATEREALSRLRSWLSSRRALLVLDDVEASAHAEIVRRSCPPQVGLLLTTRAPEVVHRLALRPGTEHALGELSETDGLELLRALAPLAFENARDEGLQLVRKLQGHPLALCVAGRLLRLESESGLSVTELIAELARPERILGEESPQDRFESDLSRLPTVAELFAQSTDRLSPAARRAFSLLGSVEPKPARFAFDLLHGLWGLEDPRPTLRELLGRGLVEPAENGLLQIHPLLAAHARSLNPS